MSNLNALAVLTGPNPDFFGASPGPKPGILGTMTWNACVSGEEGVVRESMSLRASRKEPGQAWTKSKGVALEEEEGRNGGLVGRGLEHLFSLYIV